MTNHLHELIYLAIQDKKEENLSVEDFANYVLDQYMSLLKEKKFAIPHFLFEDTKREILDEIQKVYQIRTYGVFKMRSSKG